MTSIEQQVDKVLASFGITFSAVLIGETMRDEWKCDEWRVKLGTFEIDFFTGTGHRKPIKGAPSRAGISARTLACKDWDTRYLRPVAPSAASVLYNLFLDSQAVDKCFADWCADFEYSDDSLKALETYQACCKIGQALRKVFTSEQRKMLSELLEDY